MSNILQFPAPKHWRAETIVRRMHGNLDKIKEIAVVIQFHDSPPEVFISDEISPSILAMGANLLTDAATSRLKGN